MLRVVLVSSLLVGAAMLWVAGLQLFARADLTKQWRLGWTSFLIIIGIGVGVVLPLGELWSKFLLMVAVLPVIAAADVFLFHSRRGLSYWIRACGFAVGTVFAVAAATRLGLDIVGVSAIAERLG